MRTLTRYIFKEMLGPTLLGFGFYTFVILTRQLLDLAEMIIKRSLSMGVVAELLALSLPHIIVLTIPMALLFGILIAVGRLSADSEIVAMRAAGMPTAAIYRPVFYFSFAIFLLNLFLMNVVLPRGNNALQELRTRLFAASIEKQIKPRVFYSDYANLVIYVDDIDASTGQWKGVFVSTSGSFLSQSLGAKPGLQDIIVAKSGELKTRGSNSRPWIELQNATNHLYDPSKPTQYDVSRNARQELSPVVDMPEAGKRVPTYQKSIREMGLLELVENLDSAKRRDPVDYRLTLVEIHKKLSIPFACIAFGVIGLALGMKNRRGGRGAGFAISIAIILSYYVMLSTGEEYARTGAMSPGLGMWLPNILLIGLGVYWLRGAHFDSSSGSRVLSRVGSALGRLTGTIRDRRAAARARSEGSPSLLAKLDLGFPNTMDRYVLSQLGTILLLVLVSCVVLFVIVDYTEHADEIAANKIGFDVVVAYYRYYILQVSNLVLPLSMLTGILIAFGLLARNNEVTAIKAHGVSLYRIAIPVIVLATLLSGASYLLFDFVLPYSNQRMNELKNRIMGRETSSTFTPEQRQWVFGKGRYLFNFLSYDPRRKVLSQVQVFEFHPTEFRLTRRIYAEEARYDGVGWVFVNGWIRSFSDDGSVSYTPIRKPIRLQYPERPDYFQYESKAPDQMTFGELKAYIHNLRRSGYSAEALLVDLWGKTSWPFVTLVMALIALPFSFKIGKKGTLYGIALALFLAFGYWGLFGIFSKLGEVGSLPPILAAWSANILFTIGAIYMFLHVET